MSSKKIKIARKKTWAVGDTETRRTVRNIRNINQEVLQKPNATCVTPNIAALAKNMFVRRLVPIKQAIEEAEEPEVPVCEHHGENPPIVGPTPPGTSRGAPHGYGGPGGDGASQGPEAPEGPTEVPGGHNPGCSKAKEEGGPTAER